MEKKKLSFLVQGGSVPGSDHTAPLRRTNCQDAFAISQKPECVIAVVADGNGSEANSEVGAKLGVALELSLLSAQMQRCQPRLAACANIDEATAIFNQAVRRAEQDMLAYLRVLANALTSNGESFSEKVRQNFLFTLLGAILTPQWTGVFYVGDGCYALNGQVFQLGPFPENKPPYPAYQLFATEDYEVDSPLIRAQFAFICPTDEVKSLLIGTDGVEHLMNAEHQKLPGRSDKVGPLRQFWEEPAFVENADAIRRRLALITRESHCVVAGKGGTHLMNTESGLLKDDTTLVVIQKV